MDPTVAPAVNAAHPPPLPFPRFRLSAVSLTFLGVAAATTLVVSMPRWLHAPATVVVDLGGFAVVSVLALGLAQLAWQFDARRRAGGLVFCFVMLLFLAVKLALPVAVSANAARRAAQLRDLQRQTVARQERELAARDRSSAGQARNDQSDADLIQQRAQIFQDASREAQGDDRRMLEVDARIIGAFQADVRAYQSAVTALRADGFASAAGLETREGLARRKALVQTCAQANATLTESCRTLEERCYAEMRRALPEPRATDAARRAMIGADTALALRVRDCERRMIEGAGGMVALFEREFERWHFNVAKRVVFDDADAPAAYTRCVKQIQDAGQEEAGAQREMLAHSKARLGS